MSLLSLMSVHNIALLSLDRFLYVKKPLQYKNIVTVKRVSAILVLCWVLFTAFSVLPVFGVGFVHFVTVLPACVLGYEVVGLNIHYVYYWVFIVCACLTPVSILVVTNTWMLCIMQKSIKRGYIRAKRNSIGGNRSVILQMKGKYTKDQTRLLQIFMAIFASSIVTWLPLVITISMITAANIFVLEFTTFAYLCCLSQPVIHPVLQVLLLRDVRTVVAPPYKLLPGCQCTSKEKPRTSGSSNNVPNVGIKSANQCCRPGVGTSVLVEGLNVRDSSSSQDSKPPSRKVSCITVV